MTQDPARRSPSTYKRSARAGRNKPMLITSTESAENDSALEENMPSLEDSMATVQTQNPPITSTPSTPSRARRIAGFISNVGKKEQSASVPEVDATQARLARATRAKGGTVKATADSSPRSELKPVAKKEPSRANAAPARPAGPFKTKYFVGMAIYLLGANVVGIGVTTFFHNNHIDTILTQFSLFGGQIVISTSTLVFLAILVILLVLLARFDLIPRSFSAMSGTPPPKRTSTPAKSNSNTIDGSRIMPPTMKQGVKGKHDDLYHEYRTNQRRDRKK